MVTVMGRFSRRACARPNAVPGWRMPAFRRRQIPGFRGIGAVGAVAALAAGAGTQVGGHADLGAQPSARAVFAAVMPVQRAIFNDASAQAAAGPFLVGGRGSDTAAGQGGGAAPLRRIILPDLLIVAARGLSGRQIARLGEIPSIRNMITFDGAEIRAGGRRASVIGVDPGQFRSWVPLRTASDQAFWTALSGGGFVASDAAKARLALRDGDVYSLRGRTRQSAAFGGAAQLGVSGIDLLVNTRTSRQLGLVHKVAALVSAPGGRLSALISEISRLLGPSGQVISLRTQQLPVTNASSSQPPASYLQLFRESAARYCPGLSWTVLAAIGQIESADGTNVGPSSAGALGPMQFMPSTWARWGIDGFGQSGAPDIMNPYDAVPSAARLLCGAGAAAGGTALRSAVFAYNHATWYVNEVLALAAEYAADYR